MQNLETHKSALENTKELLKGWFANYQPDLLSMDNVKESVREHWAYLAFKYGKAHLFCVLKSFFVYKYKKLYLSFQGFYWMIKQIAMCVYFSWFGLLHRNIYWKEELVHSILILYDTIPWRLCVSLIC